MSSQSVSELKSTVICEHVSVIQQIQVMFSSGEYLYLQLYNSSILFQYIIN